MASIGPQIVCCWAVDRRGECFYRTELRYIVAWKLGLTIAKTECRADIRECCERMVLPRRVVHLVKREIDQTVDPHVNMAA